jgi:hypothetical protein
MPIPNIMVCVTGMQILTDSTGSFLLENVPAGIHVLVMAALDGSFRTFSQQVEVASGLLTPVSVTLEPADLVNVVFSVQVPANTPRSAPLRMAGSLFQLGNTFSDLRGGVSGNSRGGHQGGYRRYVHDRAAAAPLQMWNRRLPWPVG